MDCSWYEEVIGRRIYEVLVPGIANLIPGVIAILLLMARIYSASAV